jgi:hypothetical protein
MRRYQAQFRPERWAGDETKPVRPEGPTSWDATAFANQNMAYTESITGGTDSPTGESFVDTRDVFFDDPAAPEWIRKWGELNPFTITITITE